MTQAGHKKRCAKLFLQTIVKGLMKKEREHKRLGKKKKQNTLDQAVACKAVE